MKKILATSAVALLLFALASVSALAATAPANAPSPDGAGIAAPQRVLVQGFQTQQTVVDQLEQARLRQVLALLKARQPAEVEFAGTVRQDRATGQWTVAGLAISQTSATMHEGALAAGLHAHVRAQIHSDGTLEALHMRVMNQAAQGYAQHHAAEWLRDDHGIHLGETHQSPSSEHTSIHASAGNPTHAAEPEHAAQPPQTVPAPAHHPEAPAQPQPPAPQPERHDDGESHGGHSGGHD